MKKLITTIAAITLGTIALASFAAPYGDGRYDNRMEMRLERMTEHLNLNEEQHKQIQAMFENQLQVRESMRGKMHNDIKSVLNEEQQAKFDAMHAWRQQKRAERMARLDGKNCDQRRGPGRYWKSGN
jgi:Spy/CpxP family protein refolding chaperone